MADGGVFSPRIALRGGLAGLKPGVSLDVSLLPGVGVPDLVGLLSGDLSGERLSKSRPVARGKRSGDRSGDLLSDPNTSV